MFHIATDDYCFELALMSIKERGNFQLLTSAQIVDEFEKVYNEMKNQKDYNASLRKM